MPSRSSRSTISRRCSASGYRASSGNSCRGRNPGPGQSHQGHFRFESGYHGDTWLDLESLFLRPDSVAGMIRELSSRLTRHDIDAVCGPVTGGAFAALLVAEELHVEAYYSEQIAVRTSDQVLSVRHRVPAALREGVKGKRVAVVNDVTSAGSAVRGTVVEALAVADQNLWEPQACPLCQSGVPLQIPSYGPAVAS